MLQAHEPYTARGGNTPAERYHAWEEAEESYADAVTRPVQSILDKTWVGTPPDEWIDFCVMDEFKWTWREWMDTPEYVQRYVKDVLVLRNQARASASNGDGDSHHSVREIRSSG